MKLQFLILILSVVVFFANNAVSSTIEKTFYCKLLTAQGELPRDIKGLVEAGGEFELVFKFYEGKEIYMVTRPKGKTRTITEWVLVKNVKSSKDMEISNRVYLDNNDITINSLDLRGGGYIDQFNAANFTSSYLSVSSIVNNYGAITKSIHLVPKGDRYSGHYVMNLGATKKSFLGEIECNIDTTSLSQLYDSIRSEVSR
ncbi:hypothetical protein [Alteromonas abrolhosensis]|uniref:hypothetical protein n=1 Tax=Alteromonas abrolhosensis TaxID=1892904 RepID=UPI00096BCB6B|nr:hypothetical protein [Alteromonas abrolhosensis]|tara:strand:+ start:727 stop:1326 length:600 start_codon:yes stop_codon:yes gene_type:complete